MTESINLPAAGSHEHRKLLRMGDSHLLVDLLRRHFEGSESGGWKTNRGMEIGVHRGKTSELLLRSFPALFLWMVDPWMPPKADSDYVRSGDGCAKLSAEEQRNNMAAAADSTWFAANRRRIMRKTSGQTVATWAWRHGGAPLKLDFVFIDGDHTLNAVRFDIEKWWPHIVDGGLLCGHDWNHPRCRRGQWGVDQAVQEWSEKTGVMFGVVGSVWWMVKPEKMATT